MNKANALRLLGDVGAALTLYDTVLTLEAGTDAYYNRGAALEELGRLDEAIAAYRSALILEPRSLNALNNLGNLLAATHQTDEALTVLDRAIDLDPRMAMSYINRAAALWRLRRFRAARSDLAQAIAVDPNLGAAWCSRGNIARETGNIDAALADYAKALAINPHDTQALWNRGQTRLLLGNWSQGWADYELRQPKAAGKAHFFTMPEWAGEDLRGRRILLFSEQGLGDAIQLSRFAGLLSQHGANVTLLVPARLRRLLDQLKDVTVVGEVSETDQFDFWAPLMSLPRYLGFAPNRIPAAPMPYLRAESDRISSWATRIGYHGRKIGICWQAGSPAGGVNTGRSIPLQNYAPLANLPGVRLISLQSGAGLDQLQDLPNDMKVETWPDLDAGPDGFLDTAAVIANLDLVVTCDTSVAHLAGALGKPVWLGLKLVPDWRWLLNRADTPWYPTMRLYRQHTLDSWVDVFADIVADLHTLPF